MLLRVLKTDTVQVDPVKFRHVNTDILLCHHDLIVFKKPEPLFVVRMMRLEPNIAMKR